MKIKANQLIETEKLNDFLLQLKQFRIERGLTTHIQRKGLLGNLLKKLADYIKTNDDEERVNVICDIIIYILNASGSEQILKSYIDNLEIETDELNTDVAAIIKRVLEIDMEKVDFSNDNVIKLFYELLYIINLLGYNVFCSLTETLKEASSKKGVWDNDNKKFVKKSGFYSAKDIENMYPKDNLFVKEFDDFFIIHNLEGGYEVQVSKWYRAKYNSCLIK